jgi:energy-converting hydrogenase Eha subunit A
VSSSAPAEPSPRDAPAAAQPSRAAAAAVVVVVGVASFKLATAVGLLNGGAAFVPTLLRAATGFATDALLALAVLVVGLRAPRLTFAVAVGAAVTAAIDVFFALAFGAPLTPSQRAWAHAVDPSLVAPAPVAAAAVAVAVVVLVARRVWRAPPRVTVTATTLAGLVLAGVVGRGIEHAQDRGRARRQAGLDDSPLTALFARTGQTDAADGRAVDAVDVSSTLELPRAPTHAPAGVDVDLEASRTAPVVVDRARVPRHVVLYIAESTAARFVDETTMPKLAALQRERTLTFVDHVAPSPISIKAIFALLCGLHPLPDDALETAALPGVACASLPETLTAAGFDAALFHGGYFAFTDKLAFLGERGFDVLMDGENNPRRAAAWTNGWGIDDRAVVDEALEWLDHRKDVARSSLLVVIPLIPHHEYFLPPDAATPFGTRTLVDRYKNALRFSDDTYARLVDGYRSRGLFDDTLFVFVGDHGEAFDEHPRNRLHGNFLYDENLRAPLIMTSSAFSPGATSRRPSSHADILPTVLDVLQVAPPANAVVQGQSLVGDGYRLRATPLFTAVPTTRIGLRGPRWKFIHAAAADDDELFDLVTDPREAKNLVDVHADVATALRARTLAYADAQRRLLSQLPKKDAWLERAAAANKHPVASVKVFNMVRRCIPFATSTTEERVVRLEKLDPPARLVGLGIDDGSRFARKGSIHAVVEAEGRVIDVDVDDRFDHSSVVRDVLPSRTVTIRLAPQERAATGCLWLAP